MELMGRRIELATTEPYGNLSNAIPGAYWSDRKKRWSLPLGMGVCRNAREVFGDALEIGPRLRAWAWAERQAETHQETLGRELREVELPRVEATSPVLAQALKSRPYQTAAARFTADGRTILNADTPGLGKTTETIAGIVEAGVEGPYLIVAPASTLNDAWEREILTRLGDSARVRVVSGSRAKRNKALEEALRLDVQGPSKSLSAEILAKTWVIINIEMVRTKVWWDCPECQQANMEKRVKHQALMAEYQALLDEYVSVAAEYLLNPDPDDEEPVRPIEPAEPYYPQERWKASDKPKANIIDCGHNPRNVKTVREHEYPQLFDREWGVIVMDECQRSLLRNTGDPTQTRTGAMLLQTAANGLRVALSGTPMRGKPQRLWGVLNWLRREVFSGYWAWVERYWHVDASGYGGAREIKGFRADRKESFFADLNRYMIRRTKAEVQEGLPPKAYLGTPLDPKDLTSPVAVWMPMTERQLKAYREMLSLSSADVHGGRLQAVGILAVLTRLKQFASAYGNIKLDRNGEEVYAPQLPSNKLDWIEQFLLERNIIGDPDEAATGKVVIVSQFTSLLQLMANKLFADHDLSYARITGAITGPKRQREIDRFNDPDSGVNVMFLNTMAGGVGVTLDAADDMVFLDETHVPDDQEQAEGRIDNRNPEKKIVQRRYWYLKSIDSIDEAIARTNARREADQKWHLDGRRGVEYAREVFATAQELMEKGR